MEKNMEELLFNLSCVEESECLHSEDWIYYINSSELTEEGDGAIWKVKKDGTENQRVQRSDTKVLALIGVDEHWIYFVGKPANVRNVPGVRDIMQMLTCINGTCNMKMTVRGSLERTMSSDDEEYWEEQIAELEEAFYE